MTVLKACVEFAYALSAADVDVSKAEVTLTERDWHALLTHVKADAEAMMGPLNVDALARLDKLEIAGLRYERQRR